MVTIYLDASLLMHSSGLPAILSLMATWTGHPSLFDLARDEVCHAIPVTGNAVSSYLTFSPLLRISAAVYSLWHFLYRRELAFRAFGTENPSCPGHYPASNPSEPGLSSGITCGNPARLKQNHSSILSIRKSLSISGSV